VFQSKKELKSQSQLISRRVQLSLGYVLWKAFAHDHELMTRLAPRQFREVVGTTSSAEWLHRLP
jgi:hypothetical protein